MKELVGKDSVTSPELNLDELLFKHDRLYHHHILRINYTTYDIRRKQDTINPSTPRRDIMVLVNDEVNGDDPYAYARVIGIYHVNVIYAGVRRADYTPHRMEFLWVRWYEHDTSAAMGSWVLNKLDCLQFPPMSLDDTFGFLDPTDVMRAAHIIPSFRAGKCHSSLSSLSLCAKDKEDWRSYYQNW